jgi:hypothetical protein
MWSAKAGFISPFNTSSAQHSRQNVGKKPLSGAIYPTVIGPRIVSRNVSVLAVAPTTMAVERGCLR